MRLVENGEGPAERQPSGTAQLLADAAERWARSPAGRFALVLRLGSLVPPPKAHQRRIARALLHEAAEREGGQVFPLANGDLVLLCRAPRGLPSSLGPLAATLTRLFAVAAPDPWHFLSCWSLAEGAALLLAYAAERLRDPSPGIWAEAALLPREPLHPGRTPRAGPALTERQTAVFIASRGPGPSALRPLFREIRISTAALARRLAVADGDAPGAITPDRDLLRGARRALEQGLLAALLAELPTARRLAPGRGAPLQLVLAPRSAASPAFTRLAALGAAHGSRLAVALAFAEVFAEPDAFAAIAPLRAAGVGLVLRDVSAAALLLARPEALGADLIALDWAEELAGTGEPLRRALAARLQTIGVDRVLLAKADDERAVLWGLARGIRRFQGRHVEAMLAAGRLPCGAGAPARAA